MPEWAVVLLNIILGTQLSLGYRHPDIESAKSVWWDQAIASLQGYTHY